MNSWNSALPASNAGAPGAEQKSPVRDSVAPEYAPLTLPLQTRIALWVLLGLAFCVLALLWEYYARQNAAELAATGTAATAQSSSYKEATAGAVQAVPPQNVEKNAEPASTPPQKPELIAALAEIEVIATLLRDDPRFEVASATARLKPFTESEDAAIRSAAVKVLEPIFVNLDSQARAAAREAAEAASDFAAEGNFPAALQALETALKALPSEAPWTVEGSERLRKLLNDVTGRRTAERARLLSEAEGAWRRDPPQGGKATAAVQEKFEALLKHPDTSIAQAVLELKTRLESDAQKQFTEKRRREAELRAVWMEFFTKFSAAVADGDLDTAEKLAKPLPNDVLYQGGVAEPEKVLVGCLLDLKSLRELQSIALNLGRNEKRHVHLTLRRGRIDGALQGVDGRQLQVALSGGGAVVGVKIEALTSAGMMDLLAKKELGSDPISLAIGILKAHENPEEALNLLPRLFAGARQPLPVQWEQRLKFEAFKRLDREIGAKLAELSESLEGGDAEKIKSVLESLRPAIAAFEDFEPLSEVRQKTVASAERIVGRVSRQRIVLQNGSSPTPEYSGLATDQISQYKDSAKKTDVGVQYGLKAGASGGLQRVLVRFDGLEAAIGKSRIKRAMLELYQIESPQFAGAALSLFRLKKPWVPDAGSWLSFSAEKNSDWAAPGASGDADAESKEEARLTLDKEKNAWRAFDVTAYVQDVLAGKTQNFGLLMRVTNGEPGYQVRFFPETDLATSKDKSLRPRLVLEVEE